MSAAYADSDVLLLASQAETYGMVVAEALARGIPVIGSEVGGVPATLGRDADGRSPGLLVPAGDADALAARAAVLADGPGSAPDVCVRRGGNAARS